MGAKLSVFASWLVIQEKVNNVVPELWSYISSLTRCFSREMTMTIKEYYEGSNNHLFKAAVTYIDGLVLPNSSGLPQRLTVGKLEKVKDLMFGLESDYEIVDSFQGKPIKWKYKNVVDSNTKREKRWYELTFHKKHAERVKSEYLPQVVEKAKELKDNKRMVTFYTVQDEEWVPNKGSLTHPMTFDKLCLNGDLKDKVLKDLQSFTQDKDYYHEIGKVWKRGYLLYGPPGTGKSSLIAAMANHLNYDIYNLSLSEVASDSALGNLLLFLPSRSILVVEDIDCAIKLQNRESKNESENMTPNYKRVTLAALLNVLDGLLSCVGDERITVFTTNYKDRLDPALLRPGRMDMHIQLSYCTFSTFKQLAAKYLKNISFDDQFSPEIEKLFGKVEVSPAEVAGELMKVKRSETPLEDFFKFLEGKEKSTVAPPSTSKLEEENDNNPSQKNGSQGQVFTETTDMAKDHDSSNHNEVKYPNTT